MNIWNLDDEKVNNRVALAEGGLVNSVSQDWCII